MSSRPHAAALALTYPSVDRARIIERSLSQEVGRIDDDRSAASLDREGRTLELSVEADDLIALRAAVNTWLSLASMAEHTVETVDF